MDRQEIVDLLESIKVIPAEDDSGGNTCCKMKVSDYCKINQVLTLLKQQPTAGEPKCKTCGDTGVVATKPCLSGMDTLTERDIPCPDCQQPTAIIAYERKRK